MIILRQKEFSKPKLASKKARQKAKEFFTNTGKKVKKVASQNEMARRVAEGSDGYKHKGIDYVFKDYHFRSGDRTAGNREVIKIGNRDVPRGSMMRVVRGNDVSSSRSTSNLRSDMSKFINPRKEARMKEGRSKTIDEAITRRGNLEKPDLDFLSTTNQKW